jgi:Fic family protein
MYKPTFTITNKLLNFISQIEAAKQIVDNAPLVPAWERKFREEAEKRTIFFSTKIEGNELDFDEAKKILKGENIQTFRRRDIKEIINYREVIEYMNSNKSEKIDKKLLLRLHKIVMDGVLPESELGAYRTCEEALINSQTNEVVFEPIEPEYIDGEVNAVLQWFGKDSEEVHPVIKAGILMYEMVRIHPFTDGNGRISRIMATYSLYSDGYDIKRFFSLEEYYDQNLEEYYKALESVDENEDDLTKWLEFFTQGLAVELSRIKDKVLDLSHDFKMRKHIGQVALNDRQVKIMSFIQQNGSIKNKDWQEMFRNVSDDTILRDMKNLIDKRIIKKEGKTKAARYVLR